LKNEKEKSQQIKKVLGEIMNQYHKIQTVFLRNPDTNFKTLLEGRFAKPDFEFLANNDWIWTEKVDGTNIRVMWNGRDVRFNGKTDNANIPGVLFQVLHETFTKELMSTVFGEAGDHDGLQEDLAVCLYGEGFGGKIQKGSHYAPQQGFILFDVKIGSLWLERDSVVDIAHKLDIQVVPVVGRGTLFEAVEFARTGYKSVIAVNTELPAEGLIMKPATELFNRRGERVITKIKFKDFAK
jgi:hypothetical protein